MNNPSEEHPLQTTPQQNINAQNHYNQQAYNPQYANQQMNQVVPPQANGQMLSQNPGGQIDINNQQMFYQQNNQFQGQAPMNYNNSNNFYQPQYTNQPLYQYQNVNDPLLAGAQPINGHESDHNRGPSASEVDRHRRRLAKERAIRNLSGEMMYSVLFSVCIIIALAVNKDSNLDKDDIVRKWLVVVLGYYIVELIFQMLQYHCIQKHGKEHLVLTGIRFLGMTFLVGWLIYGNMIYYQQLDFYNINNGLRWMMLFLLIFGYFEMLKCCCIGTIICIMVPFIFIAARRARRPNWIPAPPRFVENLVKDRFNPEQNQAFEQCAICLLDFQKDDEITPLPCDEKHYFHPECIEQWLKNNNNCPLCKKAITKEALQEQKKKMKNVKKTAQPANIRT